MRFSQRFSKLFKSPGAAPKVTQISKFRALVGQQLGKCLTSKNWLTPKVQVFTNLVGLSVRFSEILKKVFKLSGAAPTVQIIGH